METSFETRVDTAYPNDGTVGTALGKNARPRVTTTARYQRLADEDRGTGGESLADFLGYFSIGRGLAQVAVTGVMSRVVGIVHGDDQNLMLMRLLEMREI